MSSPVCPKCHDTRHIRVPGGRVRCDCIREALNTSYILPAVREKDTDVPEGPVLELASGVHRGDWRKFRHAVWRTLLRHEPSGFSYDFVRAERLVDIQMERESGLDSGYEGVRALVDLSLLVMNFSLVYPNRMFGSLFLSLCEARKDLGKPTWVFVHVSPNLFYKAFQPAGDEFFDAARKWYDAQKVTTW